MWIKTTPTGGSQAGYFYYQNDHLGTPQNIIDGQGQSVWSQKSTAFGETTVDPAATISNNLRFPGQYFDAETDRHYNGFRDYDPGVGRYSESDPIGLDGGLNIYDYVNGNPTAWVDPRGLCWNNAQAIAHAYLGGDVTLEEIGCYSKVTEAIRPQMEDWKNSVKTTAKSEAMGLPCNKTKSFNLSRSVGAQSGIFWIRGFSLRREATCTASKTCCDESKMCCIVRGYWSYTCTLNFSMHDLWVAPLDWKNDHKDIWDDWMLGTKKFYVNGSWSDSVSDSGSL